MEITVHSFFAQLDKLYEQGNHNEIERFLKEQIKNTTNMPNSYDPLAVAIYNEMATFCRGQGRLGEAIKWFESAVDLIIVYFGKNSMEYATALNNLAGAQRMDGQNEKATFNFGEAMGIYKLLAGEDSYHYISCVNNLALLEINAQNYDRAEELLIYALSVIERNQDLKQEEAITLCNLGTCSLYCDDITKAEQYLHRAEIIYRDFPKGQQVHLAAVCNSLGSIYYRKEDKIEAVKAYTEAKDLTELYFGRSIEYAVACENLSCCMTAENAKVVLRDGLKTLEELGREESQQYHRMKKALNALEEK